MRRQPIPARIRWGVDVMDVQPGDQLLEVGCGPGAAAELVCSRLETGKLFAIDRSESGVDRTKRRCASYVEAGRLTVRQIDLATLRVPVKRLHKAFAFNVNLFWVRGAGDEVALLHEKLLPGGRLFLFYEATRPEGTRQIIDGATEALTAGGFRVSVVQSAQPAVVAVVGQRVTAQV
ncbi:class I SAM-dependent methyltransferase [Nocardioides zeae]|uniref:Class I SAM-dependent methyltransferase n=1 Tax=Nocardioides imazamoxiresistens TaxID=3231893 RepID=A0ABU3PYE4_9ACTN|nr:class I SAM-dependent methyltransferase [Nocardioides zeae]MDT9593832.1 class I SAM-dependent methyltransferase [Nocardioides zeae]